MDIPVLLLIGFFVGVVVFTWFRVRQLMRRSREQWEQVDHSKLRKWDDDDW